MTTQISAQIKDKKAYAALRRLRRDVQTNTAAIDSLEVDVGLLDARVALLEAFTGQRLTLVAAGASTNQGVFTRLGACVINASLYPAVGTTYTLRAACQVDNGQTYEVRVYDVTAGAYVGGTITDTNAGLVVKTLVLAPAAGERIYELHARLTTGAGLADFVSVPSAVIEVAP